MKWLALFLLVIGALACVDAVRRDGKVGLEWLPIVLLELVGGLILLLVSGLMFSLLAFEVL